MKDVEPIHDQATDTPRRRRGGRASVGRGPGSRHGAPRARRGRRAPAVAWVADPNGAHADEPTPARSGRAAVIYWLVAGAIYIGLDGMTYQAWKGLWADLDATAERLMEILWP